MKRGFNVLFLSLATAFWGLSVVSQAVGGRTMRPFTFNSARFAVSVAALLPCLWLFRSYRTFADTKRELLAGGGLCGLALFCCINLQQTALHYVPAGNAIFICSLYMVMVPVVKYVLGVRCSPALWLAVVLACAGMWLLSAAGGLALSFGEMLCLGCAVGYTCHILLLERYAPRVDCFALTTNSPNGGASPRAGVPCSTPASSPAPSPIRFRRSDNEITTPPPRRSSSVWRPSSARWARG